MVFNNKNIFQAGPEPVCLCQSKCQQFATRVLLYQVGMIVRTNRWIDKHTPKEAVEWLEANSKVQPITEPVYEQ